MVTESESATETIARLESMLEAERTRKRAVLCVLAGMAALELSRFLAPLIHPALAVFGAVFCLVYVLYGLYLYSTQESFARKA